MEQKLKVGILGATGMVGQRFISLLENHPWFEVTTLAASPRSAGKTYEEAVGGRWKMDTPMPEAVKKIVVMNVNEVEKVASNVDFVFSAVDMSKDEIKAIEEEYAKTETPVVSNNSAHRWTPDVPMVVPEINPQHFDVIESQKKRLGTKKGFVAERTLKYYRVTVEHMLRHILTPIRKMTTEEIRTYLVEYQKINNCGKVTIDNVRRNISSFFSWLEEEDYILKSPMRRIHKIKTKQPVKETISDEAIERLRDNCKCARDLAMIDLLYSTGIRVGELVNLNISEIDFEARECVVFGKGDKERRVYFDAKAKLHLQDYLRSRTDANPALFVTLDAPFDRLKISGVEIRLRELGRELNLDKIHPHKFRRTMATRAIDKGMPIEQVQKILGHSQIGTTMQYAIVNQNNVKTSHQKFIA